MSTSSKTTEKYDKDKEFYLECLGHLMNLEFEPRSNLTLKAQNPPKKTENVPGNSKKLRNANAAPKPSDNTSCTIENISTEKAKTWKAGAISATMKKLGFPVREANSSIRPLKANTLEERLEVLNIFQFETTKLKSRSGREESSKQETNKGKAHANNESGNHKRPHSPDEFDSKKLKKDFLPPSSVDSKRPRLKNELQSEPEIQTMYSRVPSDKSKPFVEPSKDASRVKFQKMPSSVGFSNSLPSAKDSEANAHNAQSRRLVAANNSKPENVITEDAPSKHNMFLSAYDKLLIEDKRKGIVRNLGAPSEKVRIPGLFKPPIKNNNNDASKSPVSEPNNEKEPADLINPELAELLAHEKLKVFEPKIIEAILSEVMEQQQLTNWKDIAGLEGPKAIIKEIIIWPMLRPDIFTGLRSSPRGILLFGPPGTGKTMIGRLIATQSSSTFFNISASSLTSKWIGDGEKMVRCLFQVARIKQPSVIFIDEIDSILTQRSESEHESSRRLKTEFLIQFDGCGTKSEDRVLVIGVTNRPQELDEAARRRLVKRIYIPLPDLEGRKQIVNNLMQDQNVNLTTQDILRIAEITEGYSGADMKSLCQDASYGPIREIGHMLENIVADKVRPIQLQDFIFAQKRVKSSVAEKDLEVYEKWDESFGCHIEQ